SEASTLIRSFPEKTEIVASYLLALRGSHGPEIAAEVMKVMTDDRFHTDWEKCWLLRIMCEFADSLNSEQIELVHKIAADEDETPVCRVEAVKLLALTGRCDHLLVRRLWNKAPVCFHCDLVAAAYSARNAETWCNAFIDGVKEDPINVVVLKHL